MKKITISAIIIALLLIVGCIWLASGASPKHAPQDVVTVELPDTYEK